MQPRMAEGLWPNSTGSNKLETCSKPVLSRFPTWRRLRLVGNLLSTCPRLVPQQVGNLLKTCSKPGFEQVSNFNCYRSGGIWPLQNSRYNKIIHWPSTKH